MNISKHTIKRYVERFWNTQTKQQTNYSASANEQQIIETVETMFLESTLIYTGQVAGDKETMNYYLHSDNQTILVANTQNNAIITIYKINFAVPETLKQTMITELVNELKSLNVQIGEARLQGELKRGEIEKQMDETKVEIARLEELIAEQKAKYKLYENERAVSMFEVGKLIKQQEVYATTLLSNNELKSDLATIRQGK